jgi:acyl-coenzyme A synthetase/AMP-(fatty) acid ligase
MANTIPAVPLSHYATPYELRSLIEQSSITHLFVHPQFLDLALDAARAVGLLEEHIYVFGGEVLGRQSLSTMIDTVVARQTPAVKPRSVDKNTIAYLLFSSGTTGTSLEITWYPCIHVSTCVNDRSP